jgi:hypothetical protein
LDEEGEAAYRKYRKPCLVAEKIPVKPCLVAEKIPEKMKQMKQLVENTGNLVRKYKKR